MAPTTPRPMLRIVAKSSQPRAKKAPRIRRLPERAQQEILDAAEDFLSDHDFRDLSVDEVMARTGMVRSAFYNYFRDRNHLAVALLARVEFEMIAGARWLEGDLSDDPVADLADAVRQAAAVYARHGHVVRAIHEASYHDDAVEQAYRYGVLENFIQIVTRRLREEKRAGRTSVANPAEVARALLLMNATVLVERLGRSPAARPGDVARPLIYIWQQAIYPDAGRR
jgi:TetR/AcrR family transcriptional regulator, ethionamide resistance regulator